MLARNTALLLGPPDSISLKEALSINREAPDHFLSFSPTSKKTILQWIGDAKRPEPRRRRNRKDRKTGCRE